MLHTHTDTHGMVRTVTVGVRRHGPADGTAEYTPQPLTELVIGVQRMAVTLPAREQKGGGVQPAGEEGTVASGSRQEEQVQEDSSGEQEGEEDPPAGKKETAASSSDQEGSSGYLLKLLGQGGRRSRRLQDLPPDRGLLCFLDL